MGMAASQARFLGLTARKSNVEYQGQQVNQQRTALSNESANLYNQMMDLEVPTPPKIADFTKMEYTLENSAGLNNSDYQIEGAPQKTYSSLRNEYRVKLSYKKEVSKTLPCKFYLSKVTAPSTEDSSRYLFNFIDNTNEIKLSYDEADCYINASTKGYEKNKIYQITTKEEANALNGFYDNYPNAVLPDKRDETVQNSTSFSKLLNYVQNSEDIEEAINYITETAKNVSDDSTATLPEEVIAAINALKDDTSMSDADKKEAVTNFIKSMQPDNNTYFFFYDGQREYFITGNELETLKTAYSNNNGYAPEGQEMLEQVFLSMHQYQVPEYVEVKATLEQTDSGRFSSITISEDNEGVSQKLLGQTYTINSEQVTDKDAYDDAYNDYEYKKAQYEKSISDINSQTEIIQKEDQQLELRLQQLNTEQDAIKTEMDSVQQVIKDNVEKTFKVFA